MSYIYLNIDKLWFDIFYINLDSFYLSCCNIGHWFIQLERNGIKV